MSKAQSPKPKAQSPDGLLLMALVQPLPHHAVVVAPSPSVPHIAVGLWVSTLIVLLAPNPWGQKNTLDVDHLIRAYGVTMPLFSLV